MSAFRPLGKSIDGTPLKSRICPRNALASGESANRANPSSSRCATCSRPTFCGTAMRPSTPMSAMASCASCTALVSSSTQPEFGSLTKRPVALARRSRSALLSLSPSASHSAETASQSMPLPLTTSRGLSWRGCRNRRWNAGLPRNSASLGRSAQAPASEPRKFSFASPIHRPGSEVNQSSLRSH